MRILQMAVVYLLGTSLTILIQVYGYNLEVRNIWVLLGGGTLVPLLLTVIFNLVLDNDNHPED